MADSIKSLQVGAFKMEKGLTEDQSAGWGDSSSYQTLSSNDAFPWLNFGREKAITVKEDEAITSLAFKAIPRQVTKYIENPLSINGRFAGLNKFYYWMFGFENSIEEVVCFTLSTPSVEPTAGAEYEDDDDPTNTLTFLRKEVTTSATLWVFKADDSGVNASASGTLTKSSGTGDATLTYSAHSDVMYEHLYELDAHERHMAAYRTDEQITGYSSGDLKNRMATMGIKMGTNDFRYQNAMCKKFGFKSSAAGFMEHDMSFLAYSESRGDYTSSGWTFPSTLVDSDNIIAHNQLRVEVGTAEGSLTSLGITDLNVDVDIPLRVIQDCVSGVSIAEPILEGRYGIGCNMTLSRYSAETYQTLRDAWTSVVARISASYGYYMQEILVQEAKIGKAGPDDDAVAKELLQLKIGYSSNNWSTWLYDNTLVQNGPLLLRTRDASSTNEMFRN